MPVVITGSGVVPCYNADPTTQFIPLTDWYLAAPLSVIRCAHLKQDGDTGHAQIQAAYQQADDVDSPDAAVALTGASWVSSDGSDESTTYTGTSSSKQFIRYGVLAKASAGATLPECCRAQLRIDIQDRPGDMETYRGVVMASDTTGKSCPLSPWMDAALLYKAKAKLVLDSPTDADSIEIRAIAQSAVDIDSPDTPFFLLCGTGWTSTTAFPTSWDNLRENIAGKRFVRFGVKVRLKDGASGVHCGVAEILLSTRLNYT